MNKIFIDLEMNKIAREHKEARKRTIFEIIQIGAVKINDENEEVDSFNEYVRPELSSEMDRKIEKLTGIHFEQIAEADILENVFRRFVDWCGHDCEIYSWSNTDKCQIIAEYEIKGLQLPAGTERLFEHWHDYQEDFGTLFPHQKPMKLSTAVFLAGLDFSGREHDGLNDARSTAQLYILMQDDMSYKNFKKKVLSNFEPAAKTTLGDLFDFSSIQIA